MKKLFIACLMVHLLAGCSQYHRGAESMNITHDAIRVRPMEARVAVGGRIQGSASTKTLFGIPLVSPDRESFGVNMQVPEGISTAHDESVRGAVYNAMNRSGADIIVAPQYAVDSFHFLCLLDKWLCVYRSSDVTVSGYKGNYYGIRDMDDGLARELYLMKELNQKDANVTIPLSLPFNIQK